MDGSACSLSSRAAGEQNDFHRTRKGTGAIVRTLIMAMPEAVLGALLVAGSIIVYATNFYRVLEADLFATILLIQSLPFLSAVALVWLERRSEDRSAKLAVARPTA